MRSGIDWFELDGGSTSATSKSPLPELLEARRAATTTVTLGDGSVGMLPEEWLKSRPARRRRRPAPADAIRFRCRRWACSTRCSPRSPKPTLDATFEQARAELHSFDGVDARRPPAAFHGELRDYQREGLGWLDFLRGFGFGGCLADDMGLGKTVQVLALLDARARPRRAGDAAVAGRRAALARLQLDAEAARFTPQLRVLDYTGAGRARSRRSFDDYDLILTTYGTLRRDIVDAHGQFEFDYVDPRRGAGDQERRQPASAKAARLLRGRAPPGLSGTPIENHLGELWILFEFLNPGMLGAGAGLQAAAPRRTATPRTTPHAAGQRAAAVHPPPHQGAGRHGPAREDRADALLRAGAARSASSTTSCAAHYRDALLGAVDARRA